MGRKSYKAPFCVYCGEKGLTEEHFPPQSLTSTGYLFTACAECNGLAGDSFPFDFARRDLHVKDKIKSRLYEKLGKHDIGSDSWFNEVKIQKARIDFEPNLYFGYVKLDENFINGLDPKSCLTREELYYQSMISSNTLANYKVKDKYCNVCKWCNKEFTTRRKTNIYCSVVCSRAKYKVDKPAIPSKQCKFCLSEFTPKSKNNIYCSQKCGKAFYDLNHTNQLST